ncbi:unnamed protein product [Effrenium voratum]|nr:unnamed protein product [Effrenium voratum]
MQLTTCNGYSSTGILAEGGGSAARSCRAVSFAVIPERETASTCWASASAPSSRSSRSKVDSAIRHHRKEQVQASLRLVEFLQVNGFKSNVNYKRTKWLGMSYTYPLHEAVKQEDQHVVRWLLYFGADPRRRNAAGLTALDLAYGKKETKKGRQIKQILEVTAGAWQLRGFEAFFEEVQADLARWKDLERSHKPAGLQLR